MLKNSPHKFCEGNLAWVLSTPYQTTKMKKCDPTHKALTKGGLRRVDIQSYPCKQRGCFQDLKLWPLDHKANDLTNAPRISLNQIKNMATITVFMLLSYSILTMTSRRVWGVTFINTENMYNLLNPTFCMFYFYTLMKPKKKKLMKILRISINSLPTSTIWPLSITTILSAACMVESLQGRSYTSKLIVGTWNVT